MITFGKKYQIPIFPKEELERRWNLIRELMASRGIDCLLIAATTGQFGERCADLRYISNYPLDWDWGYCLLPLHSDPTLFLRFSGGSKYWAEMISWIPEIIPCRGYLREPTPAYADPKDPNFRSINKRNDFVTEIVKKVKALGLEKATLGIDSTNIMPASSYFHLLKELPQAYFVEAGDIVEACRQIKNPAELELVRKAAECADKGTLAMASVAKPGVTEYELLGACEGAMLSAGADPNIFNLWVSKKWPDGWYLHAGATNRKLQKGDVIINELIACYGGYYAGLSHTISLGEPSDDLVELFEIYKGMYQIARDGLRAGNMPNEVKEKVKRFALSKRSFGTAAAAMIMHPPINCEFKPGMVVSVLPVLYPPEVSYDRPGVKYARKGKGHGSHMLGNALIITEEEPECISKLPLEITIV